MGNRHADRLASLAAQYAQVTNDIAKPIVQYIDRARIIQLRLANIVCNLPSRPRCNIPKVVKVLKPTLDEMI